MTHVLVVLYTACLHSGVELTFQVVVVPPLDGSHNRGPLDPDADILTLGNEVSVHEVLHVQSGLGLELGLGLGCRKSSTSLSSWNVLWQRLRNIHSFPMSAPWMNALSCTVVLVLGGRVRGRGRGND